MSRKNYLNTILRFFTLTVLFICLCAFQTTTWTIVFGSFPVPQTWLVLIVFLIVKWPLYTGIFFTYFLGFIMIFYTQAPLKMMWISLNLLYIILWTLKNRIHSTSLMLFAGLSGLGSILYSVIYILISSMLEPNPTKYYVLHRLTEAGLTFLISIPLYFVFNYIDQLFFTKKEWKSSVNQSQDNYS